MVLHAAARPSGQATLRPTPDAPWWRMLFASALLLQASCLCAADGAGGQGSPATARASEQGDTQAQPTRAGDPAALALLAQARASIRDGRIAPALREQLVRSDAKEHAAARAILDAIDHPERYGPEAEAEVAGAGEGGTSGGTEGTMVAVQPLSTPPDVGAPSAPVEVSDVVHVESSEHKDGASTSAGSKKKNAPAGGTTGGPAKRDAGIAVITRGTLSRRGKDVVLRLFAGGRVLFGTVDAAESRTVRVLARNSGALPSLLSARPSLGGVKLTDVRKGIDSVQLTLELDEGWTLVRKGSFDDGAELVFRGP